jgi:flagellar basal-body rod protein FlgC
MADMSGALGATVAVSTSALQAQQARMRIIAENIANADSGATTPGGDPYQRQMPVFEPHVTDEGGNGVRMSGTRPDPSAFHTEFNPGAPGADAKGYVKMPNVDPLTEAMDMKEAQRAYDANLNMIETARAMQMRTLDIIKK